MNSIVTAGVLDWWTRPGDAKLARLVFVGHALIEIHSGLLIGSHQGAAMPNASPR
jgi:hypothetical protein